MDGRIFYFDWEISLMQWLQGHMGAFGVTLAEIFTMFGEEVIMVMIFGLLYWCIDKKAAKTILTSLMFALILNPMIKNVALRRRPYFDNEGIRCLRAVNGKADIYDVAAQGFSFPSAHSMDSVIAYGSLFSLWKNRIFRIGMVLLPIVVGASRVALGVHYPTDVLTGWVLGIVTITVIPYCQRKIKNQTVFGWVLFGISLLGFFYCRTDDYYTGIGMMAGFLLAIPVEEKYVAFQETRSPLICVGGIVVELGLNALLKLPFSTEFLKSGTFPAHLVRSGRYAVIMFVLFAVYPMVFGKIRPGNEQPVKVRQ